MTVDAMNDEQSLIDFLADRDTPCPLCGYNLRGLQRDVCPECSQALVLRVDLAEHRLGALIAALVGLGAGLGMSGLLAIAVIAEMSSAPPDIRESLTAGIGLLVQGCSLAVLIKKRRSFQRLCRSYRLGIVLAAWLLTLANIVVLMFL